MEFIIQQSQINFQRADNFLGSPLAKTKDSTIINRIIGMLALAYTLAILYMILQYFLSFMNTPISKTIEDNPSQKACYNKYTLEKRKILISMVEKDGNSVNSSAKALQICQTTARLIMSTWRKEGRIFESLEAKKIRKAQQRAERKIHKETVRRLEEELSLQRQKQSQQNKQIGELIISNQPQIINALENGGRPGPFIFPQNQQNLENNFSLQIPQIFSWIPITYVVYPIC